MSYAARSLPPERDDDATERLHRTLRQAALGKLDLLAQANIPAGSRDRQDVLRLRDKLHADREPLTQKEQDRIAQLMWKHRRQLPRGLAPKLNPADPIVREIAEKELSHVG